MAPYRRADSPFWWLCLERPGQRPIRVPTKIPIDGGTDQQTRQNAALAQAAYSAQMGDLARARYTLPTDRPVITFGAYRAWYLEHISSAKRGTGVERSILGQLGPYFDPAPLHRIDRGDLLEWRSSRVKDVAPGTVNRELTLLRHLLGSAVPKYLEKNPAAGVPKLRVPERDVRLLEPDEEERLLKRADPVARAIIVCALDTLQRLSNIANLQRAQDHGSHLVVLNPKVVGYKVPVSARLRLALDALETNGPGYFPSMQGPTPAGTRNRVARMFLELCAAADIQTQQKTGGISFHSLRHTGASRMLARGVDIKTVQQLGGWQNLNVLQKYLHPTDAQKRAAVEAVSREQGVHSSGLFGSARGRSRSDRSAGSGRKTLRKARRMGG